MLSIETKRLLCLNLCEVQGDLRVNLCFSNCVRFLEHFILNGPDPNTLYAVLAQLNDPKRQNPQELDQAVIGEARCDFKAVLISIFYNNNI